MRNKFRDVSIVIFVFFSFYLLYLFYIPDIGFISNRDTIMNIEFARWQISQGFKPYGFWSYTIDAYHPSFFYHFLLSVFGSLGGFLRGNFYTGAFAGMVTINLLFFLYLLILVRRFFSTRILVLFFLLYFIIVTPVRVDLYKFAESNLNSIYLNLNFLNLSICLMVSIAFAFLFDWRKVKPFDYFLFFFASTMYLPLLFLGIIAFFLLSFFLLYLLRNKEINIYSFTRFLFLSSIGFFLLLPRLFSEGFSSFFGDRGGTNVSGFSRSFTLLNEAISFHTYGLNSSITYIFLLSLFLSIFIFHRFRYKLLILFLINIFSIFYVYLSYPSPLTLYSSMFLTFVFLLTIISIINIFFSISKFRFLYYFVFVLVFSAFTFHMTAGGFERLLDKSSSTLLNFHREELGEFSTFLNSSGLVKDKEYEILYDHNDYNLVMASPVIVMWGKEMGYKFCIRDEKSLPFFSCDRDDSATLELYSTNNGFKSKNLDVIFPVNFRSISDLDMISKLRTSVKWPPVNSLKPPND